LFCIKACCTATSYYDDFTPAVLDYGHRRLEILLQPIQRTLVVFAETKDRAEGSNGIVVVTSFVVVTNFIAIASGVTYMSVTA
jgi:hypothetical protein